MIKNKSKNPEQSESHKSSGASASQTKKEVQNVVANPKLVAAIRNYDASLSQTKSYLVELAEIVQNEQLTSAEVVASLMEGRGIEKSTAQSQVSRMKGILFKPEVLEQVKSGEMTLKEARETTKKPQANPSEAKRKENNEKKFLGAIGQIVTTSKEAGRDLKSIINAVSSACKKAGIK